MIDKQDQSPEAIFHFDQVSISIRNMLWNPESREQLKSMVSSGGQ
jgi:hypothetical protein